MSAGKLGRGLADLLVEHDETTDQICHSKIADGDTEEEDYTTRCQVEQYEDHDEFPKARDFRVETSETVDDRSEDERRDHTEGNDIE